MPWSMENKPVAVKYLHPRIQRKAIEIANAIVREGGDDGIAIATGIKQAKKAFEKRKPMSIVKVAQQMKIAKMIMIDSKHLEKDKKIFRNMQKQLKELLHDDTKEHK